MNELQKSIADALASNVTRINPARHAPRCHYVKINGLRCGSPALHRSRLCYFHNRMRLPRLSGAPFPPLEDAASIQYALMTVLQELRDKKLDHRTAGLLLYGLQTASFNLRHARFEPYAPNVVRTDPGDLLSESVIPSKRESSSARRGTPTRREKPDHSAVIPQIHACADLPRPQHPPRPPRSSSAPLRFHSSLATRDSRLTTPDWRASRPPLTAVLQKPPSVSPCLRGGCSHSGFSPLLKNSAGGTLQAGRAAFRLGGLRFMTGRH